MRTRLAILGSLTIAGAGIWYLFLKKKTSLDLAEEATNGRATIESRGPDHIRKVFHKAKELGTV